MDARAPDRFLKTSLFMLARRIDLEACLPNSRSLPPLGPCKVLEVPL